MKTFIRTSGIVIIVLLGWIIFPRVGFSPSPQKANAIQTHSVKRGDIEVWTHYSGEVSSGRVRNITSKMSSSANIVALATEGQHVEPGDVLVQFDSIELEQKVIRLKSEFMLAGTELESLVSAKLPIELAVLNNDIKALQVEIEQETVYHDDSKKLLQDNLVSAHEVKKQLTKLDNLKVRLEQLKNQKYLTGKYLHPLALKHATAKLSTTRQELEIAEHELNNSIIKAPVSGTVVLKPFHFSGEYRVARIGDSIYPNKPFMVIPDMQSMIIEIDIPESKLSTVFINQPAVILPIAYPDLKLAGHVSLISESAQTVPGRPRWQRFFKVVVEIDDVSKRLKSGMSVVVHLQTEDRINVVSIPRKSIFWQRGQPFATRIIGDEPEKTQIELGVWNDHYFEVLGGLSEGDIIGFE